MTNYTKPPPEQPKRKSRYGLVKNDRKYQYLLARGIRKRFYYRTLERHEKDARCELLKTSAARHLPTLRTKNWRRSNQTLEELACFLDNQENVTREFQLADVLFHSLSFERCKIEDRIITGYAHLLWLGGALQDLGILALESDAKRGKDIISAASIGGRNKAAQAMRLIVSRNENIQADAEAYLKRKPKATKAQIGRDLAKKYGLKPETIAGIIQIPR